MAIITLGLLIPQRLTMPVQGATAKDYHPDSYWYYPWGKSGTHKGVDIFAPQGTEITSATTGWVVYTGNISMGGNIVVVLGPKWRLHYYAHLQDIDTHTFSLVNRKSVLGTVGTSGNAAGKPPHLHYAIATLVPYPWKIDGSPQGWKKMWYLNPIPFFK